MRCLVLLAVVLAVGACAQDVAPNTAKREYAISDRTLGYSYAGGSFKPIANTPLGLMRDGWNDEASAAASSTAETREAPVDLVGPKRVPPAAQPDGRVRISDEQCIERTPFGMAAVYYNDSSITVNNSGIVGQFRYPDFWRSRRGHMWTRIGETCHCL